MLDGLQVHFKIMLVRRNARFGHPDQIFHQFCQIEVLFAQEHLAALDAGHIQHLVDEGQQVAAGLGDLAQTVPHPLLIVQIGPGNGRHAHDGIHRRADIVGHIGQEFRLGAVGAVGRIVGDLERFPGGSLGLLFLRGVLRDEQDPAHPARLLPVQRDHGQALGLSSVLRAVFDLIKVLRLLQNAPEFRCRQDLLQRFFL